MALKCGDSSSVISVRSWEGKTLLTVDSPTQFTPFPFLHSISEAGTGMILDPGTSMSPLMLLPCPQTSHAPPPQPPMGQPAGPLLNVAFPPDSCLVLSSLLPATPVVAGDGGCGPSVAGHVNTILHETPQARPMAPPHSQTLVFSQAPLHLSATWEATCVPASSGQTLVPVTTTVVTQDSQWGCTPALAPVAPPPATQVAPTVFPNHVAPASQGGEKEGAMATCQAQAASRGPQHSTSVYKNFRCWQHFKALACRHLPHSPDAEALACFLM